MGEFSPPTPPPPPFLSPPLSFFSYPSNIDWFYYTITKIHPHFKILDPRLRESINTMNIDRLISIDIHIDNDFAKRCKFEILQHFKFFNFASR